MKKTLLLSILFLFQTLFLSAYQTEPQQPRNSEDLKKDLSRLRQKYGKEKVDRAIKVASIVSEGNNLKTIQALMDPEDKYGQSIIDEAVKKISEKNPDNRTPRV